MHPHSSRHSFRACLVWGNQYAFPYSLGPPPNRRLVGCNRITPYSLPCLLLILDVIAIMSLKRRLGIPHQFPILFSVFCPHPLPTFPNFFPSRFLLLLLVRYASFLLTFLFFLHFLFSRFLLLLPNFFPVISIPLLSCFPHIAMLSGVVLHLVINCIAILRNTLSVSESKS
ncbi:hypothetical protein Gotur_009007 [Gossypium turneri]